jgi:membrane-associated protease RseP (regulator of RpoE activity)
MLDFQTIAALVFIIILTIFVFLNRKKLDTKQLIPNIVYFSMYRTKWGLRLMDRLAKKHRRLVIYFGYAGILIGFIGMLFISFTLIYALISFFSKPETTQVVGLVLPFKAKGIFFVPFFYWILSIFVIAFVHEFAHGLVARAYDLKVKSSGFAFLGIIVPIIPAAFVEPDEKELKKRPHREQLSVFAAGAFSNILISFLFLGILLFVISPIGNAIFEPNGVEIADYVKGNQTFPAEAVGIRIGEVIKQIDDKPTPYLDNLSSILRSKKPNDITTLKTDKSTYEIKLAKNPENQSLAYLGAYLEQSIKLKYAMESSYQEFLISSWKWILGLFRFLIELNFGIGVFNLVPIGPLDGGRMLQLALHKFFGIEKGNKLWYNIGILLGLIILIFVTMSFYNILSDVFGKLLSLIR